MTETKPKRRWFSFSIRDVMLVTVIVALAIGWWLDHRKLTKVYGAQVLGYRLRNSDLNAVVAQLKELFSDNPEIRIVPDPRNNEIIINAPGVPLAYIKSALLYIDRRDRNSVQ
jgi:Bacterial type II/III secretion system short domain